MARLIEGNVIGFDTETTGLLPWQGQHAFAFSFANEAGETAYIEFDVDPFTRAVVPDQGAAELMREVLEDPQVSKVGHNLSFDRAHMEVAYGIKMAGPMHDTALLAHICNPMEPTLELKQLCKRYGIMPDEDEKALKLAVVRCRNRAKRRGWKVCTEIKYSVKDDKEKSVTAADYWVPSNLYRLHPEDCREGDDTICMEYAVKDAERTLCLFLGYQSRLDHIDSRAIYEELEQPLMHVVYKMRKRGIRIDLDANARDIEAMRARGEAELETVIASAWPGFNIDAPHQMAQLLYGKLQLPWNPERVTPTGNRSVDADTMQELAKRTDNPVVHQILRYRGSSKAYSYFCTYEKYACPDDVVPGTMVLHSDIRQLKPTTGRFSMALPNLQQVTSEESSRSPDPIDARGSFGPRKGYAWLCNDYKGMEVRVFADVAQEPNMLRAMEEKREIHDEVCDRGWGGGKESGINECIHVLGLDGSDFAGRPENVALLGSWGINGSKDIARLSPADRRKFAEDWLRSFNWSIVKAQASIGLKVTKNKGKMVTFCKVYGGAAGAIADLLHMPVREAQLFLNDYDRAFPRIREYSRELQREATTNGYITTRWGRRLPIRQDLAYQCVNYMVQGSSADLLKSSMLKVDRLFTGSGLDAHLVLCVHDELIMEIREEDFTEELVREICARMEDTDGHLGVTMPTDPSVAWTSWRHKEKLKV